MRQVGNPPCLRDPSPHYGCGLGFTAAVRGLPSKHPGLPDGNSSPANVSSALSWVFQSHWNFFVIRL